MLFLTVFKKTDFFHSLIEGYSMSLMNKFSITHDEYMEFFEKWLFYQFPRKEDDFSNLAILRTVAKIVSDADELSHWAARDCWSMYDFAKKGATA
jgi:hypothetical protein